MCDGLQIFPTRGIRRDDIFEGLRVLGFERRVAIAFFVQAEAVVIGGVYYGGREFTDKSSRSLP
jgi:toxin ParE1/3/4